VTNIDSHVRMLFGGRHLPARLFGSQFDSPEDGRGKAFVPPKEFFNHQPTSYLLNQTIWGSQTEIGRVNDDILSRPHAMASRRVLLPAVTHPPFARFIFELGQGQDRRLGPTVVVLLVAHSVLLRHDITNTTGPLFVLALAFAFSPVVCSCCI